MKNIYYDGSIGSYVGVINGNAINLNALNMQDAIAEMVGIYNKIGNNILGA